MLDLSSCLVLIAIQHYFSGGQDPFSETNSGAHPIIVELVDSGWKVRILLFALVAIAAPIVEETIFRGVLYRQLRSASCWTSDYRIKYYFECFA